MGCLQSKGDDSGSLHAQPASPSGSNFSSDVNDLFADLQAETVQTKKEGPLMKLGGRNKDRWEERNFELKNTGLYWGGTNAMVDNALTKDEIVAASAVQHMGDFACFEVYTNVKKGKTYKIKASSHTECDLWVEAINSLAKGDDVVPRQSELHKLGGRNKDKWEPRTFEMTTDCLQWGKKGEDKENVLQATEIVKASKTVGLTIATRVKKGKAYRLASADQEEVEMWVEIINEYATFGTITKREAPFLKLGGKKQDKWQERMFSIDENGLTWGETIAKKNEITTEDIRQAVVTNNGFQKFPGFNILTNTKEGKLYKLCALDEDSREEWVDAINEVAAANNKMSALADNGDSDDAEEEVDEEEEARLAAEKKAKREARKKKMAEKRAAAAAAAQARSSVDQEM